MSDEDLNRSVVAALDRLGVAYEVLDCDPDFADTAAFCEHYGVRPEESANTIVVVAKTEPKRYVACVVTAATRLDVNGAVRRRLGARKASFASAEETVELTGMIIGGVTPFALPDDLPIWVDAAVLDQPSVVVGGGSRSQKIRVGPDALIQLPRAELLKDLALPKGG